MNYFSFFKQLGQFIVFACIIEASYEPLIYPVIEWCMELWNQINFGFDFNFNFNFSIWDYIPTEKLSQIGSNGHILTGNTVIDTLLISSFISSMNQLHFPRLRDFFVYKQDLITWSWNWKYSRTISLTGFESITSYGDMKSFYKNEYMAVLFYISKLDWENNGIKSFRLMNRCSERLGRAYNRSWDFNKDEKDNEKDNQTDKSKTDFKNFIQLNIDQLEHFRINNNIWCQISEIDASSSKNSDDKNEPKVRDSLLKYVLTLRTGQNIRVLRDFIQQCVIDYESYLASQTSSHRYFLEYKEFDKEEGDHIYDEFIFESYRSFDNIFFPEKQEVMNLVNFFMNGEEFYRSRGFPYTLGLLLSGVTGGGKTSTIKAIANMTNRHIINIKLPKIINKSTLMNVMFTQRKMDKNINYHNAIFVIEDIDCNSDIVLDRGERDNKEEDNTQIISENKCNGNDSGLDHTSRSTINDTDSTISSKSGDNSDDKRVEEKEDNKVVREKNKVVKEREREREKEKVIVPQYIVMPPMGIPNGSENNNVSKYLKDMPDMPDGPWASYVSPDQKDKLTLSDLLNVIDGLIEMPGRILIMTTNYPEKLDSALIRPGRIDLHIDFNYCTREMISNMFEFYYNKELDSLKLDNLMRFQITPATVFQICKLYHQNMDKAYDRLCQCIISDKKLKNERERKRETK
jgi:AAA+ superfamily predicted ATPase